MIKRILFALGLTLIIVSSASAWITGKQVVVFSSDANPVTTATQSGIYGGSTTYSTITCFIVGTTGTLDLDIDGSLDGTTFFGLYDDITATGGYSTVNQPFNYYQIDIDTCTGCSLTITCQPKEDN